MGRGPAHYQTLSRRDLSPRQREVLELIAAGRTNGEIAQHLGISLDGAKWHVSEILTKLGVPSREAAAEWWADNRGRGLSIANLARALGTFGPWKVGAAAAGVVAAAAMGVLLFRTAAQQTDDAPACTVDDVVLEPVEVRGPDENVLFALVGRSRGAPCQFAGTATAVINAFTGDPAADSASAPIEAILTGERASLAYVTWSDLCTQRDQRLRLSADLVSGGNVQPLASSATFVVNRPPCRTPEASPTPPAAVRSLSVISAAASSFIPELGPDPLNAVYCYPTDQTSKYQKPCEVADRIQMPGLNTGDISAVFANVALTEYACPVPGSGGIGAPWILCDGATGGEKRAGIPVTFHGSSGDAYSVEQLRAYVQAAIDSATDPSFGPPGSPHLIVGARVTTVACFDEGCGEFALGIAIDGTLPAAYLTFRVDAGTAKLTAAGFAGDVALEIRRGGHFGGPQGMDFVPLIPPY